MWPAQLAKVRVRGSGSGGRGSGWAVGDIGLLTARHVVARHLADPYDAKGNPGGVHCRVVTGGAAGEGRFDCAAVWSDEGRDLALLAVVEEQQAAWRERLVDQDPTVLASPDEDPVNGVTVVGFPDALVDKDARRSDPDQAGGTLLPAAGAPGLAAFDVQTSVPDDSLMWQGMSGAAVRQTGEEPRLLALVEQRTPDRASRRLFASLLPDPDTDPGWAAALELVGATPVVEDFHAPDARRFLLATDPAGRPWRVAAVPDLGCFGVRRARDDITPQEQPFFPYLERPEADELRQALTEARASPAGPRMIVLVGDSAAGKSRLAAEIVRSLPELANHRFIRPTAQERLRDLPAAFRRGRVLVWLDDLDKYLARDLDRHAVQRLLSNPHTFIVATLRRDQLQALTLQDYASAAQDLLDDDRLIRRVEVSSTPTWSIPAYVDNGSVAAVSGKAVAAADAGGVGLGEYLAAYQHLTRRYREADPWTRTLIACVADWARVGIRTPLPREDAWDLCLQTLPPPQSDTWREATEPMRAKVENEAFAQATRPVLGSTALLTETRAGIVSNELPQLQRATQRIPEIIWQKAETVAQQDHDVALTVAFRAATAGRTTIAQRLWQPLAEQGSAEAIFNLGVLLHDSDPQTSRHWLEQAAAEGDPGAMYNLGVLLHDSDPEAAQHWYEQAAARGNPGAMTHLGILLHDSDPEAARHWYEHAAARGNPMATYNLGVLLKDSDPQAARSWCEQGAAHGDPGAMINLGVLLNESDPQAARYWYERAAARSNPMAMYNLWVLLKDSDPKAARSWCERAADLGEPDAMCSLADLIKDSDPQTARHWWEQAAARGNANAITQLERFTNAGEHDTPAQTIARRLVDASPHLGAVNIEFFGNTVSRSSPKLTSFSTVSLAIEQCWTHTPFDGNEVDIQTQKAWLVIAWNELVNVRPEFGYVDLKQRQKYRQDSMAGSALAVHGVIAVFSAMYPGRDFSALSMLNAAVPLVDAVGNPVLDGGGVPRSVDFFSRENPVWEREGILVQGKHGHTTRLSFQTRKAMTAVLLRQLGL